MSSKIIGIVWLCLVFGLFVNPALTAENSEQKCPDKQSAAQITECLRQKIGFIREEIDYLQDNYPSQNKQWNEKWNKYKKQTDVLTKTYEKKLAGTGQAAIKELAELKEKFKEHHKQIPLAFPSGPAGKGRFGAYYTRLKYSLTWDKPWRVGQHPDVVVQFDDHSYKFVFWRGTSYIPCWVTENDIWFMNEFAETYIEGYSSGSHEPLSDIYCRYSHVRIIENNDARVVVHWRYALVDYDYKKAHKDLVTGWHDWADEYYYIYPNGTAMRKIILYSSRLDAWHELQETIVLNPPGTIPEDKLHLDAITVANLKGQTQTYTWTKDGPPEWRIQPEGSCIQRTNLKAKHKPFAIVPPKYTMVDFYQYTSGDSYFCNWVGPVRPHNLERVEPAKALTTDKPSHTCLGHFIRAVNPPAVGEPRPAGATNGWEAYEETEQTKTKLLLHGLTEKSASELAVVGRAWLQAPKLEPLAENFTSKGYDQSQLAFVLTNSKKAKKPVMKFVISANEDSPVVDLAFVVKNWGESDAKLKINGKQIKRGKNFRLGHRIGMEGTDLIMWVKAQSIRPIEVEIASVKK